MKMKAAVYKEYGPPDVLQIADVEKPAPKSNDVLVRVHATTVCAADWRLRTADPVAIRLMYGLWRPTKMNILGMEFAGTVEKVGSDVTRFAVGDQVFGSLGFNFGANAEFVCLPEDGLLAIKPQNVSDEQAAAVPFGAITALHFLRRGNVQPGQRVLIYGASGSVGTFAVQLARHFGAHVTAVCSTANLELVKSLGADEVVDYTKSDFSRAGRIYDIVFDTVGKSGIRRSMRSLKPGGIFLLAAPKLTSLFGWLWASAPGAHKFVTGGARGNAEHLIFFKELIEAGIVRVVIDRRYPLGEIAAAHRYVQAGHKKGNVVIMVGPQVEGAHETEGGLSRPARPAP